VAGLLRAALPLIGWFAFLALLGPVGITRLDAVMMPLVLIALLVAAKRPALATVLVTFGAWIKVAAGAVVIPLLCAAKTWRQRLVSVVAPAAATCAAVVAAQRLAGGDWHKLTSFVRAETDRGLQVEAILATPAVLTHALKGETIWRYNDDLGTSETWGRAADIALAVSDFALPAVVLVVAALCWLARERAADTLLVGTLALMTGLIVAHKVGSPQFVAWTAPPVVAALCLRRPTRFWLGSGAALAAAAGLTGSLYPWGYYDFLDGEPLMLGVWVIRNLLVAGVFVAALARLARLGRPGRRALLRALSRGRFGGPADAATAPTPAARRREGVGDGGPAAWEDIREEQRERGP
jgi:hypothetical protein